MTFLLLPTQHRYTPKRRSQETYAFKNGDDEWQTGVLEAGETKPWLPFAEARAFVWTLNLDSVEGWR